MDAIKNLTAEELIKQGIELDEQIAKLKHKRDAITRQLDCKYPAHAQTEILRAGAFTCKRVVRHDFRFRPEGMPALVRAYGNMSAQLVTQSALIPTSKFRDILARADDHDSIELRKYVTVTQHVEFTFGMEL